ncbi:MAG: hypothetical protein WC791_04530 [Candidatus Paceibacterota bacterium]|jgi:uncharacterized membrane protein
MIAKNKISQTRPVVETPLEKVAHNATKWIGSIPSLIIHTVLFTAMISMPLFGISFETVLLVLTTIVSLEAIYLAIFIQMTVNRNTTQLHEVGKDIEEISEDIEDIQEDVEDIQEDVEEISEDIEDIQEDVEEIQEDDEKEEAEDEADKKKNDLALAKLEKTLAELLVEIDELKKKKK